MKYAVIQFINGSYAVKYEGENLDSMKYNYHDWCALLWNDSGAVDGIVKLVDENFDLVDGLSERISHPAKNA